jgi:hypothetical protein
MLHLILAAILCFVVFGAAFALWWRQQFVQHLLGIFAAIGTKTATISVNLQPCFSDFRQLALVFLMNASLSFRVLNGGATKEEKPPLLALLQESI